MTTLTYDALGLHLGITEHLAYVDIAAMGATQHSIWFDTDHEGRVEVRMDGLDPARIQAVAGEIEAHWAPRRGGVTDGLEQTRKRAAQIAALTANP